MRVVIQRVLNASVSIRGELHASIKGGMLILAGITHQDTMEDIDWLCKKISHLRIFDDENGVMNLDINAVEKECMVVSQFTLYASTVKGNRPSYIHAATPEYAQQYYQLFLEQLQKQINKPVCSGVFGADMQVSLINDGPVTICIDTKHKE